MQRRNLTPPAPSDERGWELYLRVKKGDRAALAQYTEHVFGEGASKSGSLIGKSFGRLGEVVKNPNISIKKLDEAGHYLARKINRGVKSSDILGALKKPRVVLKQSRDRYLFLSDDAAVVVNKYGKAITTWGKKDFDDKIINILNQAGGN